MERTVTVIPASQIKSVAAANIGRKKRVAAYCRVSTELEEQQSSFKNQVEYYTNMINNRPDWELAGVFADDGVSGTNAKKRFGFMDMIAACEEGRVDLVITKSISRFARNTADSLNYCRKLKNLGIPIIFEKEGINTMEASGELMFTILSSLAQEESRNISENTAWGIRSKFRQGIPHINTEALLGYDKDADGNLVINEEQASVVRRVYREFLEGWDISDIARRLKDEGIPGVHGRVSWHAVTIKRMLQNEKHVGDILMQKTYTTDFLTKTQTENNGELEQYYIKDNHPAIISRENWDAVQLELSRREAFRKRHGLWTLGSSTNNPLCSHVFCESCGGKYIRKCWEGITEVFWKCENAEKKKGHICNAKNIKESALQKAIVIAWNSIVADRELHLPGWEQMVTDGDALQKYWGRNMIAITEDGPLEAEVPELTRMMLEEITVKSPSEMTVTFLDGTVKNIKLDTLDIR